MPENSPAEPIFQRLLATWPVKSWRDTTILVGVSGGSDSVALLRMMAQLKCEHPGVGRLIVAHFDHRWRSDSADDADFVRGLAAELQLEFRMGVDDSNPLAIRSKNDNFSEERARNLRYEFFLQTALLCGARFVAVGHTANDQIETIVHHFIRGSGLRGLSGMPTTRPLHESVALIRPLLHVERSELVELLKSWHQAYRHDPTNKSTDYTRARIRTDVLPSLRAVYANADDAILRLASIARETSDLVAWIVQPILDEAIVRNFEQGVELGVARLRSERPLLIREALIQLWRSKPWPRQGMTFEKWNLLHELVHNPNVRSLNLPGNIEASTDGRVIRICRMESK